MSDARTHLMCARPASFLDTSALGLGDAEEAFVARSNALAMRLHPLLEWQLGNARFLASPQLLRALDDPRVRAAMVPELRLRVALCEYMPNALADYTRLLRANLNTLSSDQRPSATAWRVLASFENYVQHMGSLIKRVRRARRLARIALRMR